MLDFYQFSHFESYPLLHHKISTKDKNHPYLFSQALHTGEESTAIIANRHALARALESDTLHFIVANQTHSDNIHIITKEHTQGWESLENAIEDCDALITNQTDVVLTILTADCVPILLFDPVQNVIAAVHAGWKGTQSEILSKTIERMTQTFGSKPQDIMAGIGPSIGACCYEVGKDVAQHFSHIPHAYTPKDTKYMLDLPYINKQQLLHAGLNEQHIEMSNICTACEVDRFFSYRKENGCSGRFMSVIVLQSSIKNK